MKSTIQYLFLIAFVIITIFSCGPSKQITANSKINVNTVSVGFYNLENLFDTINQENNDEEFLPTGAMRWNGMKYKAKQKNMAYAISQIGLDITPGGLSILGVAEIENRGVLEDLVKQPDIADRNYQIVHYDSPDRRGVDVGLIYNPLDFVVTDSKSYRLRFPDAPDFLTRDQLLVSGYLLNEKIHVIVGHWPSRIGGEVASAPRRNAAAALSKHIVDSLYALDANAKIIIMGDMNDDPFNESTAKILNAKKNANEVSNNGLYNPMWLILESGMGSLVYNGKWNLFDQIIISKPLIHNDNSHLRFWKAEVFNKSFLIQQEGSYKGNLLRTHAGGVWLNGYSDHFPTLIYLIKSKQ